MFVSVGLFINVIVCECGCVCMSVYLFMNVFAVSYV